MKGQKAMKIKRILNHNAIVVKDQNEEKILLGAGIAFNKKKNDIVDPSKIEKPLSEKIHLTISSSKRF